MTTGVGPQGEGLHRKGAEGAKAVKNLHRFKLLIWMRGMTISKVAAAAGVGRSHLRLESIAVLADFLKLIHETPNLDWLLLTKRPENWASRITAARDCIGSESCDDQPEHDWIEAWLFAAKPPANVWMGTSVEDQQRADDRIPELLKIPARIRFLSVEPMLGPIDIIAAYPKPYFASPYSKTNNGIHWAIFGGESGGAARVCDIDWIRDGVRQCRAAGAAPFVKQLGANVYPGGVLHDKKGGDMAEWPEDLRIREFPGST